MGCIPDFDRYNSDGAKARLKHSRHSRVTRTSQDRRRGTFVHHKARTNGQPQKRREEQQRLRSCCRGYCWNLSPAPSPARSRDREPTASSLIDEGVTGADISAVERASDAGDSPGLWVHRLREGRRPAGSHGPGDGGKGRQHGRRSTRLDRGAAREATGVPGVGSGQQAGVPAHAEPARRSGRSSPSGSLLEVSHDGPAFSSV